ncbi:DUF3592 domain-containing protein [Hymenobacter sediminis]|uniref:DUF3592 domain-containing protein n=1 Tax=Hymenobacter sediminis TaxID=2218621 RepID=UPI001EE3D7E8|nr:hypothetical protein [Hymenobacter sediminis]
MVRNHHKRNFYTLTPRYRYRPDSLQTESAENHRRRVQELRPGSSVTVRFWPGAPRRVEVEMP